MLKGIDVKKGCHLITDNTNYLAVGYREEWIHHDFAEHLVVYVSVKMFHQLPVGEADVGFQYHKSNLGRRTENVLAPQTLPRQPCFSCYTVERKHGMKPVKLTLVKTLATFFQNIELCKAQS